jgi:hypothetical protein
MKDKVPIPYQLSQWGSGTEVFYKCPKCGCDMRLLGRRQNYCYECGQKLDWKFCIQYVTEEIKEQYCGAEISYFKGKITYEEKKQIQNNIMFEIYRFASKKKKELQNG